MRGVQAAPQRLADGVGDALLALPGEYPALNSDELAMILVLRAGRDPFRQAVMRVLETGPISAAPPWRILPLPSVPDCASA